MFRSIAPISVFVPTTVRGIINIREPTAAIDALSAERERDAAAVHAIVHSAGRGKSISKWVRSRTQMLVYLPFALGRGRDRPRHPWRR